MKLLREQIWGIVFLAVCAACLISFWMGGASGDGAMGFSILWFYIIIPITAFFTAMMYGRKKSNAKWAFIIVCGLMGMILGWATFALANTLSFGHWNIPSFSDSLFAGIPALIGMFIGHVGWGTSGDTYATVDKEKRK